MPTEETEISTNSTRSATEEEDSWSCANKTRRSPRIRSNKNVRELRSRFVYGANCLKQRSHISLRKRHSLSLYSSCEMHEDSDVFNGNDSEDEIFSSRARRASSLRHSRRTLSQLEKRTALSLRPIRIKSYADPHSPLTYNSDDSEADKDVVRRSKRKKKLRYTTMSWLIDNQMPKVGYPNLVMEEYSEEDSRDTQDESKCHKSNPHRNNIYETRRTTRLSHELNGLNMHTKSSRRRKSKDCGVESRDEERNLARLESNDNKENKLNNSPSDRTNGKIKIKKELEKKSDDNSNGNDQDDSKEEQDESKLDESKTNNVVTENENREEDPESSESYIIRKVRRSNVNHIDDSYSPKRTRNRKFSESSSSSEVNRVYSLRQRAPKPSSKPKLEEVLRPRRRFTRMRQVTATRSSSDSTDSDDLIRKPSKYRSNTVKNPHNKGEHFIKSGRGGSKPVPIGPDTIDNKVRFTSVGGLDGHVQCLKEMILLPMMYPEVFKQFQIQPPRGVLFYGPPGTGKTLIARALANECSFGSRKVSFFMRKGADLLSKWVGESEKQLRLLFEQAQEMKPSIIFFDELDGLAPVRSARQDQIHASIVSTLLALMDGLDNRGEVIIIGATNRIDAIDPALRRPGRFDRELFFPLPAKKEREEILNVHVSQWTHPPRPELISYLSETAIGYSGSDLRALCTEAVIQSFRRTYPQVYTAEHRLLLDPNIVMVEKVDFLRAKSLLVPASHRVAQGLGRKLMAIVEPVLRQPLLNILKILRQTFPHGLNPTLAKVKLSAAVRPAQMLLLGDGPRHGQTIHLAPAILHEMEHVHAYILDLAMLYRETSRSPEEACLQVFQEARRNIPSVIFIPNIDELWALVNETVKSIFISQISQIDPNVPILFLSTANIVFSKLPKEIKNIFSHYRGEVFQVNTPNSEDRKAFFTPLLIDACIRNPKPPRKRATTPPPLPRAPTPPLTPLGEESARKVYEQEECTLRELRIFLRDMCKKLASNKMFFMFTKPVDTEEVPDYTSIIKQPMDLETMMTKVDFHRYECARDFLIDIELIVQNALEYNPAKTSADKQIRHRACSLRDYAHTLIKNEMDSDFEDRCQSIAKKRIDRKASVTQYLPAYITTADMPGLKVPESTGQVSPKRFSLNTGLKSVDTVIDSNQPVHATNSSIRKRKFNNWQRGYLKKKRRKEKSLNSESIEEKVLLCSEMQYSTPILPSVEFNSTNSTSDSNLTNLTNVTTPLTVNCNILVEDKSVIQVSSPLQSPKMKVSELLSPSELLEDQLDLDDIDKALSESLIRNDIENKLVDINIEELNNVLDEAVKISSNRSLESLLDLYNQLGVIIRQYSRTIHRMNLPKELLREVFRYKRSNSLTDGVNDDVINSQL